MEDTDPFRMSQIDIQKEYMKRGTIFIFDEADEFLFKDSKNTLGLLELKEARDCFYVFLTATGYERDSKKLSNEELFIKQTLGIKTFMYS